MAKSSDLERLGGILTLCTKLKPHPSNAVGRLRLAAPEEALSGERTHHIYTPTDTTPAINKPQQNLRQHGDDFREMFTRMFFWDTTKNLEEQ